MLYLYVCRRTRQQMTQKFPGSLDLLGHHRLCSTDRCKLDVKSRTRGRWQRINELNERVLSLKAREGAIACVCVCACEAVSTDAGS